MPAVLYAPVGYNYHTAKHFGGLILKTCLAEKALAKVQKEIKVKQKVGR